MKTVIITGTSAGIGYKLSQIFSDKKFKVISLSRSSNITEISSKNIEHISFDITSDDDHQKLINYCKTNKIEIDILINNAGLLINKTFNDITVEDFRKIYEVNLFGVVKLIKNLFEFFSSDAHIVNISSIGGLIGSSKFKGLTAYSSSKAALNVLTEVLAEEYKDSNLTFNSLCLGSVQTKMLEKAFPGYKAEVSPLEMAEYIFDFSVNGKKLFSGKVIPISKSNP